MGMTDAQWETACKIVRVNRLRDYGNAYLQGANLSDGMLLLHTALAVFDIAPDGTVIVH